MTPKERELLQGFLQQLEQTRPSAKDSEAEALIRDASARQPDSAYLLVQRAMGLDLALQAAQGQIAKLQADLNAAKAPAPVSSGFLDNPNVWGRQATPINPAVSPQVSRAQAPAAPAPAAAQAAPSAWGSGMLGTLATTAAGVVAGSLLYQGIQGLMGHHTPSAGANSLSEGPPAGMSDGARETIARDDGARAEPWIAPDPDDQMADNSTFLADSDGGSYDDDNYA